MSSEALVRREGPMHDLFTALCFVAIVIVPTVVATRAAGKQQSK